MHNAKRLYVIVQGRIRLNCTTVKINRVLNVWLGHSRDPQDVPKELLELSDLFRIEKDFLLFKFFIGETVSIFASLGMWARMCQVAMDI